MGWQKVGDTDYYILLLSGAQSIHLRGTDAPAIALSGRFGNTALRVLCHREASASLKASAKDGSDYGKGETTTSGEAKYQEGSERG